MILAAFFKYVCMILSIVVFAKILKMVLSIRSLVKFQFIINRWVEIVRLTICYELQLISYPSKDIKKLFHNINLQCYFNLIFFYFNMIRND